VGFEDAADEQGENQIAVAIALGAKDTVEADPSGGAKSGKDMAVRQGSGDGEGIAFGGNDSATLEHAAQTFDVRGGPIGEIAEGPFADLAILTVALSQQDRRRRIPVGDGFDIHYEA
jgi:hypothetical protein